MGRGVCGTAFRARQACISNDFSEVRKTARSTRSFRSEGARSGAAFPLLVDGQPAGVMLFISSEKDTFTASSPNCCSGSPTMSPLRSEASIAPTRRRGPRSRRSA